MAASADPSATAVRRLRRTLAGATLVMLGLSWPLWVNDGEIARVPFVRGWPEPSGIVAVGAFGVLVGAVGTVAVAGSGRWANGAFAVSLVLVLAAVAGDQERFQPWIYQYILVGLVLATAPPAQALRRSRWWFVALYAWSGLSKLDRSFVDGLGLVFLRVLARPITGADPTTWPSAGRTAATLAMPLAEVVLAALLARRGGPRQVGRVGAIGLHLALIAVLSPLGLGHSAIVLVWNLAVAVEVAWAFGPDRDGDGDEAAEPSRIPALRRWLAGATGLVLLGALLLPASERLGFCDAWPGFALYASHVERAEVEIAASALDTLPPRLRAHAHPTVEPPWQRLDLTGWSRAVRGTPIYPQNRATLGLADALALRYGEHGPVRVILLGPADLWTGRRSRTVRLGRAAIRQAGARGWLNGWAARDGNDR